jgi:hypothetical protein
MEWLRCFFAKFQPPYAFNFEGFSANLPALALTGNCFVRAWAASIIMSTWLLRRECNMNDGLR